MLRAVISIALFGAQFFMTPANAGCPAPERTIGPFESARVDRDLVYCERGGSALRLDLARPASGRVSPLILFVHGGAWVEGSRNYFSWEIEEAASRGFAAATIDYRVKTQFPAALADIRCAVRWFRAHASELHIDPWSVGIAGASAGGHLALLAGVTPDGLFNEVGDPHPEISGSVQAVVNFFGPSDLQSLTQSNPNLGPAIYSVFPNLSVASPIQYLSPSSPPILTVHGTLDDTVSFQQAILLDDRAREVGARHELVACAGEGHGFFPSERIIANDHLFGFFARAFSVARKLLR